jgi:hypothetical protein
MSKAYTLGGCKKFNKSNTHNFGQVFKKTIPNFFLKIIEILPQPKKMLHYTIM